MESIDLEMGDLFEDQNEDVDEIAAPPPFPELEENPLNDMEMENQEGNEEGDEEGHDLSKLKSIKAGAAKRVVKRPQPKMDSARLTGDKGIPLLPKLFKDVKFKGKGHESEDLRRMMQILEHWGHRLFPKMPFDELLERCERLGTKKDVQTCVKKIRSDMPLMDEDFVSRNYDSEGEDQVVDSKNKNDADLVDDFDAEEAFDEMMRQEAAKKQDSLESTPPIDGVAGSPSRENNQTPSTSASKSMTSEQLARIERNKQLAKERRMAKIKNQNTAAQPIQQTPSSEENMADVSIPSQTVTNPVEQAASNIDKIETESKTCKNLEGDSDFPDDEILQNCLNDMEIHQATLQEKSESVAIVNHKMELQEDPQSMADQQTEEEILASLEEDENTSLQTSLSKAAESILVDEKNKNRDTLKDATNLDLEANASV